MDPASEIISTEVRNLLRSLNEHNYESVVHDLSMYFNNGVEESMLVVATCLDHFDVYEEEFGSKDLEPIIASLFRILMQKPHCSMTFAALMRNRSINEDFLDNLSTALKLSACEKIGFGLSLLDSENYDIRIEGRKFCTSQCKALCDIHDTLVTVEADVLDALRFLEQSEVLSKHVDSFKVMILEVWLDANSRFILADKVQDSVLLSQINFPIEVSDEFTTEKSATLFAKMLGYWNQLSSRCGELQAEGIQLRADVVFSLLMSCYRHTCQASFPLASVCGNVWEHTESQLLFLKHAVSSPEVFTFAHCKRQLEYVDHVIQADDASQPWLCLDLLEVLCQLAEKGHVASVWSMMEYPLNSCPEVLLLGMAHVITPYDLLQHEVSKSVVPMLLKDSSKSGVILRLWRVNPLLLSRALNHSLSLDLENMNRVVDLFQELEILSSVLDLVSMPLGIKLASLASRKEFIDLVEWLRTNLSAFEDTFFEECIKFVKEVESNSGVIWKLYKETSSTVLKVLRQHADSLATDKLSGKMESLYLTCMQNSQKMKKIDNILDPSTSGSYADNKDAKMQNLSSPSTASTPGKVSVTSAMFGCAISIDTLLAASGDRETPIEVPPSETQDKILFVINNLSTANVKAKAEEFIAILEERFYPWFAQYFVTRRAGIEANFHMQYIDFFEKTQSKQLNNEIVQATYENCKVLLKSELIKSSVEERKLLKNLGSWLGKLTIGRNQPLLAKHINPESLITEAYEKGLMIGVIPFISKILESCQCGVAYQPPNPWTMAILGLLVEINAMPNLKANLTFEIEVLFKNLNVDMKEVKPTTLLKDKARINEDNPDFSQRKTVEEVKSTLRSDKNQVKLPANAAGPSHIVYQTTRQASKITESQSSALKTHILGLLPMAMNKAIEELISTVVERSVSIATQTAVELALKEHMNDPDEVAIHSASSLMAASLAGSLSSVTCKEPLRILTSTHLRNSIKGLNIPSDILEDAMKCVIDENIHLGCASIEKDATEKGLTKVKKEITQQLSIRKKQKEDSKRVISKIIEPSYTTDAALNKVQVLLTKLEALIAYDATEAEIQLVAAEVRAAIFKCIRKDEAAFVVAQKVFEGLCENASNTANISSRLTILAVICDVNQLVAKELTGWVLNSDDIKFNKDITVGLICKRLLNLEEYSFHMTRLINAGKSGIAIEFAISLVRTLETSDARVLPELRSIIDALIKVTSYRPVARNDDNYAPKSSEADPLRAQVGMLLAEWCRVHTLPGVNETYYASYVQEVYRNVLSKSDDMPSRFFNILLEIVVSHYRSFEINPNPMLFHQQEDASSHFLSINVYTNLVFSILRFYPVNHIPSKLSLMLKVLIVIAEFVIKDANERKTSFNPKPYFQLFINIFTHLSAVDSVFVDANFQVLASIAYSFHIMQPAKVPEFSFAWLELVQLGDFLPKLLNVDNHVGWPYFKSLVIDLLRFMEPLLRSDELSQAILLLYNGTLRMLLVLSHDFPDFICFYRSNLCDVTPPHCFELRNIILGTMPQNMRTPRPEQPQLEDQSADLDLSTILPYSLF